MPVTPRSPATGPASPAGQRPSLLALMFSSRIAASAVRVSAVVGTVLNVINNGPQLWQHHTVNLWQVLLNFAVPFCVSAYSAARNERSRWSGP
jgi:hypothetical protein